MLAFGVRHPIHVMKRETLKGPLWILILFLASGSVGSSQGASPSSTATPAPEAARKPDPPYQMHGASHAQQPWSPRACRAGAIDTGRVETPDFIGQRYRIHKFASGHGWAKIRFSIRGRIFENGFALDPKASERPPRLVWGQRDRALEQRTGAAEALVLERYPTTGGLVLSLDCLQPGGPVGTPAPKPKPKPRPEGGCRIERATLKVERQNPVTSPTRIDIEQWIPGKDSLRDIGSALVRPNPAGGLLVGPVRPAALNWELGVWVKPGDTLTATDVSQDEKEGRMGGWMTVKAGDGYVLKVVACPTRRSR